MLHVFKTLAWGAWVFAAALAGRAVSMSNIHNILSNLSACSCKAAVHMDPPAAA
jgi:hypothetical protein